MRADWTASGACTSGLTAPPVDATRQATGCATTTHTVRAEPSHARQVRRVAGRWLPPCVALSMTSEKSADRIAQIFIGSAAKECDACQPRAKFVGLDEKN